MVRKCDSGLDAALPALIVTYGATPRKHRPLDRDVLVIGQHRSCDLGLGSPEVSPVHCLVFRSREGWRVRDCGGRGGTRLNGRPVQESRLCDGDTLQIGPFSFQAHLPPEAIKPRGEPAIDLAGLARLRRSRRHLARLALALRRRLRATDLAPLAQAAPAEPNGEAHQLTQRREELERFAQHLQRARQALRAEEQLAEADLREQRDELKRMMTDLRQLHELVRNREQAALQMLRRENERMREALAHAQGERGAFAP